jgi:pimeloyl-ACP methyl ester carboxylesterase
VPSNGYTAWSEPVPATLERVRPVVREVEHLPGPPAPGGARLVAVPGLGLSVDVPRRTLERLQPWAGSSAVALPGYGAPAGRGVPLAPALLADHLLDRLDALDLPRAVLFGHSASCQVVAQVAARAPDRVAALVLVGPTTDPRAATWPRLAARWLRTAGWERPGQVPLLVRDYAHTGLRTMAVAMDAARRDRIDAALAVVRCPTLIVRGRHDRIAPRDWTIALATGTASGTDAGGAGEVRRTTGRAETLPAGGHMVPVTHPGPLARVIRGFLDAAPLDRVA